MLQKYRINAIEKSFTISKSELPFSRYEQFNISAPATIDARHSNTQQYRQGPSS